MAEKSKYAVYFDWTTGLRVGGPPGYLANLKLGFERNKLPNAVEFLLRDASAAPRGTKLSTNRGPIFAKGDDVKLDRMQTKNDEIYKQASFLANFDGLHIGSTEIARLDPQSRSIIHVHTTVDAVKIHNTLTSHGCRHNVLLALTTHSPEMPAKEWAEKAFSESSDSGSAELLFFNHREIDLFAFHAADILIFPCQEAIDPYVETFPEFKKIFGQRDMRFVPTGALALEINSTRNQIRAEYHIPEDSFVISYAGRHNAVKGYDILSRVGSRILKSQSDVTFLIGGREGPLPSPSHERWISAGWTDKPGDLINASDIFVLPNKQTYFDLMLIEVLSLGKIIVASRTGGNRFFDGKSPGIFLYDTEIELENVINYIKSLSHFDREILEENNRQFYLSSFTPEIFADNYLNLLHRIHNDYNSDQKENPYEIVNSQNNSVVSIIVAAYNVERYLERCLQSIADQTYINLEILVVNDGSTDSSSDIIDSFVEKDHRFRRIDRINGGLSAARNTGLSHCSGDYINFVDGDDMMSPDMIELLIASVKSTNTMVAVCGVKIVGDNDEFLADVTSFLFDEIVYPKWKNNKIKVTGDVLTSIYPSAWNKLYHKSVFGDIKYPVGLYYEDHTVFYKIFLQLEEFGYVNKSLYMHRQRTLGRITKDGSRRIIDIFVVLDMIESILREAYPRSECQRLMARLIVRLSWERSWVVADPIIRFKLAEQMLFRLKKLSISSDDAKRAQDIIIERDFIDKMEELVRNRGGLTSPNKFIWPIENLIHVEDCTIYKSVPEYKAVDMDYEGGFILVHPVIDAITTAAVHGFYHFGPATISFSVMTENDKAQEMEFRILVYPFSVIDKIDLLQDDAISRLYSGKWKKISSFEECYENINLDATSPTLTIYLQTRPVMSNNIDFAWVRFRNFRVLVA